MPWNFLCSAIIGLILSLLLLIAGEYAFHLIIIIFVLFFVGIRFFCSILILFRAKQERSGQFNECAVCTLSSFVQNANTYTSARRSFVVRARKHKSFYEFEILWFCLCLLSPLHVANSQHRSFCVSKAVKLILFIFSYTNTTSMNWIPNVTGTRSAWWMVRISSVERLQLGFTDAMSN